MPAGRKPALASLRVVSSTRPNTMASQAPPEEVVEPRWRDLLGSGREARDARAYWRTIVPRLADAGVLSRLDEVTITEACICWARIREAERGLTAHGAVHDGERGPRRSPWLIALAQYRQALRYYISELGLSPVARARLAIPRSDSQELDLD